MGILSRSDKEIIERFYKLATLRDVADLLEVKYKYLLFLLFAEKRYRLQYRTIYVTKKNGDLREINAPITPLKKIQKKISYILSLIYRPPDEVCGFVEGKNIVDNAKKHIGSDNLLNIDLKNFFPTIHFGRVKGLLIARPYNLLPNIAKTIANLCCFDGRLPQGAPSSPILSNMVCYKLDWQLKQLTKKAAVYTRYADDITFSQKNYHFFDTVVQLDGGDDYKFTINEEIIKIVSDNKFLINDGKVRLRYKNSRQEVTGIVVNKKVNLRRSYIKKTRSMLYAWSKFGIEKAREEFIMQYDKKNRIKKNVTCDFDRMVYGRINYIKMVLGSDNVIFKKLYNKYNKVKKTNKPLLPFTKEAEIEAAIWIVRCGRKQGTAVLLRGVGLVTCCHVIEEFIYLHQTINISQCDNPGKVFTVMPIISNQEIDLAILNIEPISKNHYSLKIGNFVYKNNASVVTSGFPEYANGDRPQVSRNVLCQMRNDKYGRHRAILQFPVYSGQSGGPVLDNENNVIGILKTGAKNQASAQSVSDLGFIPINYLIDWVELNKGSLRGKVIKILSRRISNLSKSPKIGVF